MIFSLRYFPKAGLALCQSNWDWGRGFAWIKMLLKKLFLIISPFRAGKK